MSGISFQSPSYRASQRLLSVAPQDTRCAHPFCGVTISAGVECYPARLRKQIYCSHLCRERDTKRLTQERRRSTPANAVDNMRRRTRKYGITAEQFDRLYSLQMGRCAICTLPLSETRVHVDHDHYDNTVRGLLCNLCNPGLGYFGDDPDRLERAAAYIREARRAVVGEGVKDT